MELYQLNAATGLTDWRYEYRGVTGAGAQGFDLALAADGSIYVCGVDNLGLSGTSDVFVQKLGFVTGIQGVRARGSTAEPEGTHLFWELDDPSRFAGFLVERGDSPAGSFHRLSEQLLVPGERCAYVDSSVEWGRIYYYRLIAVARNGSEEVDTELLMAKSYVATGWRLRPATPNPASEEIRIGFEVPSPGGHARLEVIDVRGRVVRILFDGVVQQGAWTKVWDGRGRGGVRVGPGAYFLSLTTPQGRETTKIVIAN
jgi:hypothetical protein